jgi:hypothetical protein
MVRIKEYILNLRGPDKLLLCEGKKKTGFLGFLVCIESLISMYSEYVLSGPLRYILPYKFSQDHLELFFCAIRTKGGHNNNPSAVAFKAAYKRLLMHTAIKGSNGNCVELYQTPISILFPSSSIIPKCINEVNEELKEAMESIPTEESSIAHDHTYFRSLSQYVDDVVPYVGGFVVRSLKCAVKCDKCWNALLGAETTLFQELKSFNACSEHGLTKASKDVIILCKEAERQFRIHESGILKTQNPIEHLTLATVRNLSTPVFRDLREEHFFDEIPDANHIYALIKIVIAKYLKIRIYYFTTCVTENLFEERIRNVLTKRILFENQ